MSICLKDNKIIFHLIPILLLYSNYNVLKQCVKKITLVIQMRYFLFIVCYSVHFSQWLLIISTYFKIFCLSYVYQSIFINYSEIINQMFKKNPTQQLHNEMLVNRRAPIGARHFLTRTCFILILWRCDFKASLMSHWTHIGRR